MNYKLLSYSDVCKFHFTNYITSTFWNLTPFKCRYLNYISSGRPEQLSALYSLTRLRPCQKQKKRITGSCPYRALSQSPQQGNRKLYRWFDCLARYLCRTIVHGQKSKVHPSCCNAAVTSLVHFSLNVWAPRVIILPHN